MGKALKFGNRSQAFVPHKIYKAKKLSLAK